jgi:hypothetical protein
MKNLNRQVWRKNLLVLASGGFSLLAFSLQKGKVDFRKRVHAIVVTESDIHPLNVAVA